VVPRELHLRIGARRGAEFPCPGCEPPCKAHDFKEMTRRHLNVFPPPCHVTAPVPRVECPEHGARRIKVPWPRAGSRFTLVFEQAADSVIDFSAVSP
jgi:transposase